MQVTGTENPQRTRRLRQVSADSDGPCLTGPCTLSPQSQSTLEAPLSSSHYRLHKGQPGQGELCYPQSQGTTQKSLRSWGGAISAYYTVFWF